MMLFRKWLALAAWAFVPLAAVAQQDPVASPHGKAKTTLGAIAYESAFEDYRAAGEQSETPDLAWRIANEEMARLGGHAGHMKDGLEPPAARPRKNAMPKHGGGMDHGADRHGGSP